MKNLLKLSLVAIFAMVAASASAQKMGQIDYQALIMQMPEMDSVQIKLQVAQKDYEDQLESLQVEINNKINDYQKAASTLSDGVKELKEGEITDLQTRLQEYYQIVQEELAKVQASLMAPVEERAHAAIKKIAKANGIVVVFHSPSVIYLDEDSIIDVMPLVKKELGIVDKPNTTTTK